MTNPAASTPNASADADKNHTGNTPQRFIRDNVLRMQPYVPGEQVNQALKLNTNECAWPASPKVFEALGKLGSDQLRQYPSPSSDRLLQQASQHFGCKPSQILAGNGSDDCLTIIYRSICKSGSKVVCPWPSYGLYDTLAAIQDVQITHIPYRIEHTAQSYSWALDPSIAEQDAALCLIANPNNPSGTSADLETLLQVIRRFPGIVVVDEAYVDFSDSTVARAGLIPYIKEFENLIVIRTFSKSYSLAGARVGLLFADETLIKELDKVKDSYNVNVMSQIAAEAALTDVQYHQELVQQTITSRKQLETVLATFGWTWPKSEANFLLCYVGDTAQDVYKALKERGILVRWWSNAELNKHLRITAGTPEQNQRLIQALQEILA